MNTAEKEQLQAELNANNKRRQASIHRGDTMGNCFKANTDRSESKAMEIPDSEFNAAIGFSEEYESLADAFRTGVPVIDRKDD